MKCLCVLNSAATGFFFFCFVRLCLCLLPEGVNRLLRVRGAKVKTDFKDFFLFFFTAKWIFKLIDVMFV